MCNALRANEGAGKANICAKNIVANRGKESGNEFTQGQAKKS